MEYIIIKGLASAWASVKDLDDDHILKLSSDGKTIVQGKRRDKTYFEKSVTTWVLFCAFVDIVCETLEEGRSVTVTVPGGPTTRTEVHYMEEAAALRKLKRLAETLPENLRIPYLVAFFEYNDNKIPGNVISEPKKADMAYIAAKKKAKEAVLTLIEAGMKKDTEIVNMQRELETLKGQVREANRTSQQADQRSGRNEQKASQALSAAHEAMKEAQKKMDK